MPKLTVVAGPNGSGKSTFSRSADFEGRGLLIDPDALARELNPTDPLAEAFAAGRLALERTQEYFRQSLSFAVETTLAGRRGIDLMRDAKGLG
jgi:predicted ABC-type ATPase